MSSYKLTQINIYPVKSLGGIPLESSEITPRGLKYDRRWMITDEGGNFMSQRTNHLMALIGVSLDGGNLVLRERKSGESVSFGIGARSGAKKNVVVWGDPVEAECVGSDIDAWLSEMLKEKCTLVHMPEDASRMVDPAYAHNKELVSFADAFPFLLIGEASLEDLNSRLAEKLPMNRFRPNLVFSGGAPFDEDRIKSFTLSGIRFYPSKPCSRCVVTTINQDTGERSTEPLKTLAEYRASGNKIYFGQNLLHSGTGTVKTGSLFESVEMRS